MIRQGVSGLIRKIEAGEWARKGDLILLVQDAPRRKELGIRNPGCMAYLGQFEKSYSRDDKPILEMQPCIVLCPEFSYGNVRFPAMSMDPSLRPKAFSNLNVFDEWYLGQQEIVDGLASHRELAIYAPLVRAMKEPFEISHIDLGDRGVAAIDPRFR